jgi:uncharacterized membrane protein
VRLVALATAALTVALGLRHVNDALWQDEVASARIIVQPNLVDVIDRVRATESTPPLWYVLAWAGHRVGLSVVDVRLLSLVATAAAAALVVVFARRILPLPLAGLCGLLVALGSQFAAHSHELRAYALLLLVTLLFAVTLDAEVERPSLRREAALAVLVAAGLLTHYFFALSLFAALVWLWFEPEAASARRRATAAVAAGAAAFLPWLPSALGQYRHDRFWWIGPLVVREVVNTPFRLFSPLQLRTVGQVVPIVVLLGALSGALLLARGSRAGRLAAVLAFGPLLVAALAWWAGVRVFATRNLLETGPFLAIALARAVAAVPRRPAAVLALCLGAAVVVGYARSQDGSATPYDSIARSLVAEGWRPADPIALYGNFFAFRSPLEWYLPARPPLALARPRPTTCRTLFLVRTGRHVAVERISVQATIRRLMLRRHLVVLTDPLRRGCAHAITSGRFSASYGLPSA